MQADLCTLSSDTVTASPSGFDGQAQITLRSDAKRFPLFSVQLIALQTNNNNSKPDP